MVSTLLQIPQQVTIVVWYDSDSILPTKKIGIIYIPIFLISSYHFVERL